MALPIATLESDVSVVVSADVPSTTTSYSEQLECLERDIGKETDDSKLRELKVRRRIIRNRVAAKTSRQKAAEYIKTLEDSQAELLKENKTLRELVRYLESKT